MTPFRYQSSEGGGIITVFALNQDEADAVWLKALDYDQKTMF